MTKNIITRLAAAIFALSLLAGCQKTSNKISIEKADQETRTFINAPDGLMGELKDNYVDFQFDYPKSWVMDPASSQDGASNFVRVERRITDKGGKFTQENFAVGYFKGSGSERGDKALLPKIAKQLEEKFAHGFSDYHLISQGATKVGDYSGYGFRFSSIVKNTAHGNITVWGRTVLLPNPKKGQTHGVTIVMMGSSLAPEIKSASDVGVKGQLPVILKSFKIGKTESNEQ